MPRLLQSSCSPQPLPRAPTSVSISLTAATTSCVNTAWRATASATTASSAASGGDSLRLVDGSAPSPNAPAASRPCASKPRPWPPKNVSSASSGAPHRADPATARRLPAGRRPGACPAPGRVQGGHQQGSFGALKVATPVPIAGKANVRAGREQSKNLVSRTDPNSSFA